MNDAQLILKYYTQKTVAGKDVTWEDILGKKQKPLPPVRKQREDVLFDPERFIPEYVS